MADLTARLDPLAHPDLAPAVDKTLSAIMRGAMAYPPIGELARAARLERLTGAGAWAEAAIALLGLAAPDWRLRRLELDGGEWWCTLSRHPRTPREFDDAVDGRDPLLALAILDALLEARQRATPPGGDQAARAPEDQTSEAVWCDNTF